MPAWALAACSNSLAQVQLVSNANCTAWEERAPDEVRDWISLPRYPRTAPSSLRTDGLMAFPNRKYLDLRVSFRNCETKLQYERDCFINWIQGCRECCQGERYVADCGVADFVVTLACSEATKNWLCANTADFVRSSVQRLRRILGNGAASPFKL